MRSPWGEPETNEPSAGGPHPDTDRTVSTRVVRIALAESGRCRETRRPMCLRILIGQHSADDATGDNSDQSAENGVMLGGHGARVGDINGKPACAASRGPNPRLCGNRLALGCYRRKRIDG